MLRLSLGNQRYYTHLHPSHPLEHFSQIEVDKWSSAKTASVGIDYNFFFFFKSNPKHEEKVIVILVLDTFFKTKMHIMKAIFLL